MGEGIMNCQACGNQFGDSFTYNSSSGIAMAPSSALLLVPIHTLLACCHHCYTNPSLLLQVFSAHVVRDLHSDNWKDREQGLTAVTRSITSPQFMASQDATATYMVTAQMTERYIK